MESGVVFEALGEALKEREASLEAELFAAQGGGEDERLFL